VGIRDAQVVHGHIKESCGAECFARRFDFFQMTPERLLAFVKAEDCLEYWRTRNLLRRVKDQSVVYAMTNCSLESLMQNSSLSQAVDFLQFGFERRNVPSRPLLYNRRINAAKLRHMKKRPRALKRCRRGSGLYLASQPRCNL